MKDPTLHAHAVLHHLRVQVCVRQLKLFVSGFDLQTQLLKLLFEDLYVVQGNIFNKPLLWVVTQMLLLTSEEHSVWFPSWSQSLFTYRSE